MISDLLNYHIWADSRLQTLLMKTSDDTWAKHLDMSENSLSSKCIHMIAALDVWMQRMSGTSPVLREVQERLTHQSKAELLKRWSTLNAELVSFITNNFNGNTTYTNSAGKEYSNTFEDIYTHLFLHQQYHRGQVVAYLRNLNQEIVNIDYIVYHRSKS